MKVSSKPSTQVAKKSIDFMNIPDHTLLSLAVAIGIGLLVGTERERRKDEGPDRSPAGVRTFALVSLAGAVSFEIGREVLLAVVTGGIFVLTTLATSRERDADPGLTTDVALVVTGLLGGLAMTQPELAAGLAVAMTIMLNARSALHRFVRSVLSEDEVRDGLIFAAATLIVLPLLPNEEMGPFEALNPHAIWIIVILVMAIGALGHVAVRALGSRFGLPVAGLASGFVSSVATIGSMGARAREAPEQLWPAAAGAALSSVATIVEMAVLIGVTDVATLKMSIVPLACAGVAAAAYGAIVALFALRVPASELERQGAAFNIWTALGFAALLTAIVLVSRVLQGQFGMGGVVLTAAVVGLANVDPAVISVAYLVGAGKVGAADAVVPILVALSTNTLTKLVMSFSGGWSFALCQVPGLLLVILAAWAGWELTP